MSVFFLAWLFVSEWALCGTADAGIAGEEYSRSRLREEALPRWQQIEDMLDMNFIAIGRLDLLRHNAGNADDGDTLAVAGHLEVTIHKQGNLLKVRRLERDAQGKSQGEVLWCVNEDYAFSLSRSGESNDWQPLQFSLLGSRGYETLRGASTNFYNYVVAAPTLFDHWLPADRLLEEEYFREFSAFVVEFDGKNLVEVRAKDGEAINQPPGASPASSIYRFDPGNMWCLHSSEFFDPDRVRTLSQLEYEYEERPHVPSRVTETTLNRSTGRPAGSEQWTLIDLREEETAREAFFVEFYGLEPPAGEEQEANTPLRGSSSGASGSLNPLRASLVLIVIAAVIAATVVGYAIWKGRRPA